MEGRQPFHLEEWRSRDFFLLHLEWYIQMGDTASISSSGVGLEIQEYPGVEMVRLWTWTMAKQWRTKNGPENLCRRGPESKGYALGLDKWGKLRRQSSAHGGWWTLWDQRKGGMRKQDEAAGCLEAEAGMASSLPITPWDFFTSPGGFSHSANTWEHSGAAGTCVSLPTANLSYWNAFTCIHRERKLLGVY